MSFIRIYLFSILRLLHPRRIKHIVSHRDSIGAKITATFSKSSTITANEGPYICGIECSDSTSLPTTNAGVLISTPNTTFRIVGQEDGSKSVVATYSANNTYPDFADGLRSHEC